MPLRDAADIDDDILLKSRLVLESFLSFLSSLLSSLLSRLFTDRLRMDIDVGGDLASLIRRPSDLQLLSEEDLGRPELVSLEGEDEGGTGDVDSVRDRLTFELDKDTGAL